jgi:flagellar hook-associated protein 1 FlgK
LSAPVDTPPDSGDPFPGAPNTTRIVDATGADVTDKVGGGQLAGLLQLRNTILPSLIGDGQQQGKLNLMAQSLADDVNQILLSGQVTDPPSTPPVALFTYDTAHTARAASSLSVNPAITAQTLAAIQTTPTVSQNGIPVQLAQLRDPSDPALLVNGMNYSEFAIEMASGLGSIFADASARKGLEGTLLTQAQNLRQQTSGVSLEQEAVMLLEFQRSYQATTRVVNVLDELTQSVLNMV